MKAIYINLDPYLAAFAAWLKGGKSGDPPKFDPLPLAVTIPLGETAAIYLNNATTDDENVADSATIDGQTLYFCVYPYGGGAMPEGGVLAFGQVPGLSALAPSAKYAVVPWDAWKADNGAAVEFWIGEENDPATAVHIVFTVLVRREQASGPVDLVDFTPALTAAQINAALGGTGAASNAPLTGVKLTGATNAPAPSAADIKSALVAAGTGALDGVSLAGTVLNENDAITTDVVGVDNLYPFAVGVGDTITHVIGYVTQS